MMTMMMTMLMMTDDAVAMLSALLELWRNEHQQQQQQLETRCMPAATKIDGQTTTTGRLSVVAEYRHWALSSRAVAIRRRRQRFAAVVVVVAKSPSSMRMNIAALHLKQSTYNNARWDRSGIHYW